MPNFRLRLVRANSLRLRGSSRIPADLIGGTGIDVTRDAAEYTIDLDFSELGQLTSFDDLTQVYLAVQNATSGAFGRVLLSTFINNAQTTQTITTGDVTVANADGLIIVNKTVGAATTVTLGAAASKIGPVKIVDFKGDAGTNNITINAAGSDKFNGALSSWVISGDGGSVVLHPHSGGWAV